MIKISNLLYKRTTFFIFNGAAMKNQIILVLVLMLAFTSCGQKQIKEVRGSDSVTSVSAEDLEMNKIIDEARKTLPLFLEVLGDESISKDSKSVKYPFDTDVGSDSSVEHIWLSDITVEDGKYFGIVGNDPFYIKNMKLGDKVEFDIKKISDWSYFKDGHIIGGKSIKYFYDRLTEEERKDFDKNSGLKFKE